MSFVNFSVAFYLYTVIILLMCYTVLNTFGVTCTWKFSRSEILNLSASDYSFYEWDKRIFKRIYSPQSLLSPLIWAIMVVWLELIMDLKVIPCYFQHYGETILAATGILVEIIIIIWVEELWKSTMWTSLAFSLSLVTDVHICTHPETKLLTRGFEYKLRLYARWSCCGWFPFHSLLQLVSCLVTGINFLSLTPAGHVCCAAPFVH